MQDFKSWIVKGMTGPTALVEIFGFAAVLCRAWGAGQRASLTEGENGEDPANMNRSAGDDSFEIAMDSPHELELERTDRPIASPLCYRGIHTSSADLNQRVQGMTLRRRADVGLCYRGVNMSLAESDKDGESHSEPVDSTLCYRGVNYSNQNFRPVAASQAS